MVYVLKLRQTKITSEASNIYYWLEWKTETKSSQKGQKNNMAINVPWLIHTEKWFFTLTFKL